MLVLLLVSLTLRQGGLIEEYQFRELSPWLESLRGIGYFTTASLMCLAALLILFSKGNFSRGSGLGVAAINITFQSVLRIRDAARDSNWVMIVFAVCLAVGAIVLFAWLIPVATRGGSLSARGAIHVIFWGCAVWAIISMGEWLRNPASVQWMGRFLGISGHPNHAGTIAAIGTLAGTAKMSERQRRTEWGITITITVALAALVIFSGSRAALVLLLLGAVWQYLPKKLALIVIPLVLAIASAVVLQTIFAEEAGAYGEIRVLSTLNTRGEAWVVLWEAFSEEPVFGKGVAEFSENSFLVILARSGLVGGAIFLLFWIIVIQKLVGIRQGQNNADEVAKKGAASIVIGCFCCGLFEGLLKDELAFPIFCIYIIIGTLGSDAYRIRNLQEGYGKMKKGPQ